MAITDGPTLEQPIPAGDVLHAVTSFRLIPFINQPAIEKIKAALPRNPAFVRAIAPKVTCTVWADIVGAANPRAGIALRLPFPVGTGVDILSNISNVRLNPKDESDIVLFMNQEVAKRYV